MAEREGSDSPTTKTNMTKQPISQIPKTVPRVNRVPATVGSPIDGQQDKQGGAAKQGDGEEDDDLGDDFLKFVQSDIGGGADDVQEEQPPVKGKGGISGLSDDQVKALAEYGIDADSDPNGARNLLDGLGFIGVKKPDKADEPTGQKDDGKTIDEEFPDVEIPENVSVKAAQKFKIIKDQAKQLKDALAANRKEIEALKQAKQDKAPETDWKKTEEGKKLLDQVEEQRKTIERLRLEESDTFKSQYEAPLKSVVEKIGRTVKTVEGDARKVLIGSVSRALSMDPGEDSDADFATVLDEIEGVDGLGNHAKRSITAQLERARELNAAKQASIANWQETRQKLGVVDADTAAARKKAAEDALIAEEGLFETENAQIITSFRSNPHFGYDDAVLPVREKARKYIAESMASGVITKDARRLIIQGAEFPFMAQNYVRVAEAAKTLFEKLREAHAQIVKLQGQSTGGGKNGSAKPGQVKQKDDSGDGSAIMEVLNSLDE